jgi:hypothetical protein
MLLQTMLHKVVVVALIIIDVKIVFHEGINGLIMRIRVWVPNPRNVDKNGHLVTMPMRGLCFILNFKVTIIFKVYY